MTESDKRFAAFSMLMMMKQHDTRGLYICRTKDMETECFEFIAKHSPMFCSKVTCMRPHGKMFFLCNDKYTNILDFTSYHLLHGDLRGKALDLAFIHDSDSTPSEYLDALDCSLTDRFGISFSKKQWEL